MSVAELLNTMSAGEIIYWQAYSFIEPFGEERADYRAGMICATIANVYRTADTPEYKPQDFMPKFYKHEGTEPTLEGVALKTQSLKKLLSR